MLLGANNGAPFAAFSNNGGAVRTSPGAALAAGWHHLALVAGAGRVGLYVDGDSYASVGGNLPALSGTATIGGDGAGVASALGFAGEMDELQISRAARPAGFLKLAAAEQGPDAGGKVISVGDDEAPASWLSFLKKGYLGVILGSLTPDGWAVIAILAVMSLVSWGVMITKAMYLNRVGKSNAEFIRRWREVAADLSAIDQPEPAPESEPSAPLEAASPAPTDSSVKAPRKRRPAGSAGSGKTSPLFQIYHLGIEEIRHRLDGDKDGRGKRAISARSIEAIRASLDGGFVRESQRLTSQMVLLTIAISGGPFLGLLGTVVGVMITFAAVAQAGEVNVNAIAPGIAAALAATVAGLGVAIPALFGYNYLLGRIKSTTSDMQVFIDEFVTRLAEFYGDE
jgi:biopolymer transport protein ExbB